RRLRCESGRLAPGRHDNGHLPTDEIGGECRQAAIIAPRPPELDCCVLTLDEATLLQPAAECFEQMDRILRRPRTHESDQRHHWLLRARRERPRQCRPADQRDELTSPHIGSQAQATALYPLKQVL